MELRGETAHWIAIRTRSRFEKTVRHHLEHRGVECFLPTLRRISRWKQHAKTIEWPLFPEYIFVRLHQSEELSVLQLPGVVKVVRYSQHHDEDIVAIQRMAASGLQVSACAILEEGTPIEAIAIRGPLQGLRGRLVCQGGQSRIIRTLEAIGRAAAVDVDPNDVAILDEEGLSKLAPSRLP